MGSITESKHVYDKIAKAYFVFKDYDVTISRKREVHPTKAYFVS